MCGLIVAEVLVFLIGSLRLDFIILPRLEEKRVKRRCGPTRGVVAHLTIADDLCPFRSVCISHWNRSSATFKAIGRRPIGRRRWLWGQRGKKSLAPGPFGTAVGFVECR